MFHRIRQSANRHPLLRDAILWALPALFFGAFLRALLLAYQPYAYWGSDSNSYFSFAHMLLGRGLISLDEKRRLLYPLLMVPVSLLPGAPLRSVAWVQHGLGLLTILPFAYVVRKSFVYWRAWMLPVTLLYAANPIVVWYEHELIGDSLFFAALVWAFAGWSAWAAEPRGPRARSLFWWFFAGLAVFILTKPSGRFVWPGIVFGLLLLGAWRTLSWKQWSALFALCLVGNMLGSKKQGAWLFYTATFPLTQLETPLHAEYKAQIRDLVEPLQRDVSRYFMHSKVPFDFLERPGKHPERPLWHALATDAKKRTRIYMDLAIEGVKARPGLFLALSLQRMVVSANPSYFKEDHFAADYFARRFEHHYEEAAAAVRAQKPTAIPMLFGLPRDEPLPPYETFRQRLAPDERSPAADWLTRWAESYERHSDLVYWPSAQTRADRTIDRARPTLLGWWMLAGALLAFLPRYCSNIGVFTLVAAGYLVGVFLVSLENARYFAPALPLLIVLLAVPADLLARLSAAVVRGRRAPIP